MSQQSTTIASPLSTTGRWPVKDKHPRHCSRQHSEPRRHRNKASCNASVGIVRNVIVFEVIYFSFFLLSSLIAQSLKLATNLLNSLDPKDPHKADIDSFCMKYGLLGTTTPGKTNIHVTALDGIVNVNSLFTAAIFIGFSLTAPEAVTAGTQPKCTASPETVRRPIVFEVVSFSFFLYSSLIAQSLKLVINLINSVKNQDDPHKADIDQRALKYRTGSSIPKSVPSPISCL
ncbi:hypothetical protein CDL12_03427 [Handroanthus impetiginosus]|uniref:Uncharacterized protein n=1 Tax=Handroanthus impetiginosus TaxID=429701 RepID=A0A2G9I265_9LAMI|nr:hypothetical protein CDL12_03427 [Handroanthus impetiginosus]